MPAASRVPTARSLCACSEPPGLGTGLGSPLASGTAADPAIQLVTLPCWLGMSWQCLFSGPAAAQQYHQPLSPCLVTAHQQAAACSCALQKLPWLAPRLCSNLPSLTSLDGCPVCLQGLYGSQEDRNHEDRGRPQPPGERVSVAAAARPGSAADLWAGQEGCRVALHALQLD